MVMTCEDPLLYITMLLTPDARRANLTLPVYPVLCLLHVCAYVEQKHQRAATQDERLVLHVSQYRSRFQKSKPL